MRFIKDAVEFKVQVWRPKDLKPTFFYRFTPLFYGFLSIHAVLKDGTEIQTVLPINRHEQHGLYGDVNHYCVPINWELFDIVESSTYKGNQIPVHFDNSIRISYRRKGFWFSLAKDIERNWNSKTDEYLEVYIPNDFEILFTLRFQYGLRRTQLFEALGLKLKSMNWKRRN